MCKSLNFLLYSFDLGIFISIFYTLIMYVAFLILPNWGCDTTPSFRVGLAKPTMYRGFSRRLLEIRRQLHTLSSDGPSESLRRKIVELERTRKARKSPEKDQLFVEVPESKAYLDTASMPMILTVVGVALFAKLLFMVIFSPTRTQPPISHFALYQLKRFDLCFQQGCMLA